MRSCVWVLIKSFFGSTKCAKVEAYLIKGWSVKWQIGLFGNETILVSIIKRLLDCINNYSERAFIENRFLNTLVILNEAHRLSPIEKNEKKKGVKLSCLYAEITTRKYGLGCMFITQILSNLHKEIINKLRIFFFVFVMTVGTELISLREIIGRDRNAINLYQSFSDSLISFDTGSLQYSFTTTGPISPLSFEGSPLLFTSFNTVEEFLINNIFFKIQQVKLNKAYMFFNLIYKIIKTMVNKLKIKISKRRY
jgi:hypothetical protein